MHNTKLKFYAELFIYIFIYTYIYSNIFICYMWNDYYSCKKYSWLFLLPMPSCFELFLGLQNEFKIHLFTHYSPWLGLIYKVFA